MSGELLLTIARAAGRLQHSSSATAQGDDHTISMTTMLLKNGTKEHLELHLLTLSYMVYVHSYYYCYHIWFTSIYHAIEFEGY